MACGKKLSDSIQVSIPSTAVSTTTATIIPLGQGRWLPATGFDAWRGVVRVKSAFGGGTIRAGVGVQTAPVRTDNPDAFDNTTIQWGTAGVAESALNKDISANTAGVLWCRLVVALYLTAGSNATACSVEVEIDYVACGELLASKALQLNARSAVDFEIITGFIPIAWINKVKAALILANAPSTAKLWLAYQLASTNTVGTNANGGPGAFTTSFVTNPATWPIVTQSESCTGELQLSTAATDTWARFAVGYQLTTGSDNMRVHVTLFSRS